MGSKNKSKYKEFQSGDIVVSVKKLEDLLHEGIFINENWIDRITDRGSGQYYTSSGQMKTCFVNRLQTANSQTLVSTYHPQKPSSQGFFAQDTIDTFRLATREEIYEFELKGAHYLPGFTPGTPVRALEDVFTTDESYMLESNTIDIIEDRIITPKGKILFWFTNHPGWFTPNKFEIYKEGEYYGRT